MSRVEFPLQIQGRKVRILAFLCLGIYYILCSMAPCIIIPALPRHQGWGLQQVPGQATARVWASVPGRSMAGHWGRALSRMMKGLRALVPGWWWQEHRAGHNEDDWKEFEQKEVNYNRLRVQAMQIRKRNMVIMKREKIQELTGKKVEVVEE